MDAYIDKYSSLVSYLADNATGTPTGDAPSPEQTSKALSLQVHLFLFIRRPTAKLDQLPVIGDNPPIGKNFGDILIDVGVRTYHAGDTVRAQFVGANPRVRFPIALFKTFPRFFFVE